MFSLFKEQQLELLRSKGSLFFVVLFPTVLVFLLGTMLAPTDNPDEAIEPLRIAWFVDGTDAQITATAEAIVAQFDAVEQIELVAGSSRPTATDELASGALSAVVVFTQPFGIELHEGRDSIQNRAARAVFEGVARLYGTLAVLPSAAPEPETGMSPPQDAAAASASTSATSTDGLLPRVEEATFGVSRSMIDYYAITMIVMMFFMGSASTGASVLYYGRKDGTLRRTLASPLSRLSVYLQYALSSVPYNLLQVTVVMVASTLFLGAHYASTWEGNVLLFVMLFCVGLAASTLSLLLGLFVRVNPMAIIMLIMWPMMFVSGTFAKPLFIPGFSEFLPPAIVQQAAFDLTLFGNPERCVAVLLVSLLLTAVATVVGAALFNKKEVAA
ncbi:MAG: ABC transporter permease [Coriobacteriales bacterium]|jgi:ABC-2 type transport system permease protein|nr:ABC transporter permease [Coriobacteriales bacterium]